MLEGSKKPRMRSTMLAASPQVIDTSSPLVISTRISRRSPGAETASARPAPAEILIAGDNVQQSTVAHLQLVAAGVRGVQQAQTHPAARNLHVRALYAIHQQRIADEATCGSLYSGVPKLSSRLSWMMTGKSSTP